MRDGNKEAAKELLSTFRLIVGGSIAIFVLFANLQLRGILLPSSPIWYTLGLGSAAISTLLCGWLFFLVVGKLHREEEDIAYQLPVLALGGVALLSFVAAVVLVLVAQL